MFYGPFWFGDGLAHNNKPDGYAVTKERNGERGQHEVALEFISFISFAKICTGITLAQSIQSYKSSGKHKKYTKTECGKEAPRKGDEGEAGKGRQG